MKDSNDNDKEQLNDSDTNNLKKKVEMTFPIRITSKVIKGFGRGSKELGIPTANLCPESTIIFSNKTQHTSYDDLPNGVYWGYARIIDDKKVVTKTTLKTALSIGHNPQYNNKMKTIEPHLIATESHPNRRISKCNETLFENDFYGADIRLSIIGFIRSQCSFNGLDDLIAAIKGDIKMVEEMEDVDVERLWVNSD